MLRRTVLLNSWHKLVMSICQDAQHCFFCSAAHHDRFGDRKQQQGEIPECLTPALGVSLSSAAKERCALCHSQPPVASCVRHAQPLEVCLTLSIRADQLGDARQAGAHRHRGGGLQGRQEGPRPGRVAKGCADRRKAHCTQRTAACPHQPAGCSRSALHAAAARRCSLSARMSSRAGATVLRPPM